MTHLIETDDGEIFEVTTLFDPKGEETRCLHDAWIVVIKVAEDDWRTAEIGTKTVHRLQ